MQGKLYELMARRIQARINCDKSNNIEWFDKHTDTLNNLLKVLPHGSGLDYDWNYDIKRCHGERIVLTTAYHSMDEYYDATIDFTLTVIPSLQFGFNLLIKGNFGKHQDIKEYLYDILREALNKDIAMS